MHGVPFHFLETLDHVGRPLARTLFPGLQNALGIGNLTQGLELSDRWIILARGRIVNQGRSADTDPALFEREYFDRLEAVRSRRGR